MSHMKKHTETIRTRVSKSLLKRTEARAEAEFLTVSSIVRKALTLYLQEQWWLITKKKK